MLSAGRCLCGGGTCLQALELVEIIDKCILVSCSLCVV